MNRIVLLTAGAVTGCAAALFTNLHRPLERGISIPTDHSTGISVAGNGDKEASRRTQLKDLTPLMFEVNELLSRDEGLKAWLLITEALSGGGLPRVRISSALGYVEPTNRQKLTDIFEAAGMIRPGSDGSEPTEASLLDQLNDLGSEGGVENIEKAGYLIEQLTLLNPHQAFQWIMKSGFGPARPELFKYLAIGLKSAASDWDQKIITLRKELDPEGQIRINWPLGFSTADFFGLFQKTLKDEPSPEKAWEFLKNMSSADSGESVIAAQKIIAAPTFSDALASMPRGTSAEKAALVSSWLRFHCGSDVEKYRNQISLNANDSTLQQACLASLVHLKEGKETMRKLLSDGNLGRTAQLQAIGYLFGNTDSGELPAMIGDFTSQWPSAREVVLAVAAQRTPDSAHTKKIIDQITDEELKVTAANGAIQNLVKTNGSEAMNMALDLSGGHNALNGLPGVAFSQWMRSSPYSASEWLAGNESLAESPRDVLVNLLISNTLEYDPESALPWINTVKDPEIKQSFLDILALKFLE